MRKQIHKALQIIPIFPTSREPKEKQLSKKLILAKNVIPAEIQFSA